MYKVCLDSGSWFYFSMATNFILIFEIASKAYFEVKQQKLINFSAVQIADLELADQTYPLFKNKCHVLALTTLDTMRRLNSGITPYPTNHFSPIRKLLEQEIYIYLSRIFIIKQ
jgi:hypothetical protein